MYIKLIIMYLSYIVALHTFGWVGWTFELVLMSIHILQYLVLSYKIKHTKVFYFSTYRRPEEHSPHEGVPWEDPPRSSVHPSGAWRRSSWPWSWRRYTHRSCPYRHHWWTPGQTNNPFMCDISDIRSLKLEIIAEKKLLTRGSFFSCYHCYLHTKMKYQRK